jgi:hypothetical protein
MNAPLETLPALRGLARLADLRPVIVTDIRVTSSVCARKVTAS